MTRHFDRGAKYLCVGFQGADFVRKNQVIEVIEDAIVRAKIVNVRLVRVGNEDQWIVPFQRSQQVLGNNRSRNENGRPGLTELREFHLQLRGLTQVLMKLICSDLATLVTANPGLVPEDLLELIPGNGTA